MSWSSGKDSALALHEIRSAREVEITGLLTTVNAAAGRVTMHDVRRVLLEAQASGLPVVTDGGFTEVAPGSATVVADHPALREALGR